MKSVMRVFARALVILAVAFLAGFGLYRLGQAYGSAVVPERARPFRGWGEFAEGVRLAARPELGRPGEFGEGRAFPGGRGRFEGGEHAVNLMRGLFGLLNNLITVTVIIVPVVVLAKGVRWVRRHFRARSNVGSSGET